MGEGKSRESTVALHCVAIPSPAKPERARVRVFLHFTPPETV